jgi:hypothetical protein
MMGRNDVRTAVIGGLHGWRFQRDWCHWTAVGPELPLAYAAPLHDAFNGYVRAGGETGPAAPSAAVRSYSIDSGGGSPPPQTRSKGGRRTNRLPAPRAEAGSRPFAKHLVADILAVA